MACPRCGNPNEKKVFLCGNETKQEVRCDICYKLRTQEEINSIDFKKIEKKIIKDKNDNEVKIGVPK